MPADMLERLQERKLRAMDELEQLIEDWKTADFRADGNELAAAVADFMVDEGIGLRQGLLRLWDYHWTAALSGKVADRRQMGATLRSLLERGARSLARSVSIARTHADLSGQPIARLVQFEEQVRSFPLWIEESLARWELLDRPHKPLDRERCTRAQTAFARGECESASDILARLEQGGPLLQE